MDEAFALIGVGLCIFCFVLVLYGIGSYAGGNWAVVANGIAPYILIVTGFAYGCYVLVKLMGRR